jgi:hypothetical protein
VKAAQEETRRVITCGPQLGELPVTPDLVTIRPDHGKVTCKYARLEVKGRGERRHGAKLMKMLIDGDARGSKGSQLA